VIETHEHAGEFREFQNNLFMLDPARLLRLKVVADYLV